MIFTNEEGLLLLQYIFDFAATHPDVGIELKFNQMTVESFNAPGRPQPTNILLEWQVLRSFYNTSYGLPFTSIAFYRQITNKPELVNIANMEFSITEGKFTFKTRHQDQLPWNFYMNCPCIQPQMSIQPFIPNYTTPFFPMYQPLPAEVANNVTVEPNPSSFFSPQTIMQDTSWYDDEKIDNLLHFYLLDSGIDILTSMLGNEWQAGNTLQAALKQRKEIQVFGKVIIPVNLGTYEGEGAHWVLLYIDASKNKERPYVIYVDPFGRDMHSDVKEALTGTFAQFDNKEAINSTIKFQSNHYDCGPWIIEFARHKDTGFIPSSLIDIQEARKVHSTVLALMTVTEAGSKRKRKDDSMGPPTKLPIWRIKEKEAQKLSESKASDTNSLTMK